MRIALRVEALSCCAPTLFFFVLSHWQSDPSCLRVTKQAVILSRLLYYLVCHADVRKHLSSSCLSVEQSDPSCLRVTKPFVMVSRLSWYPICHDIPFVMLTLGSISFLHPRLSMQTRSLSSSCFEPLAIRPFVLQGDKNRLQTEHDRTKKIPTSLNQARETEIKN